MSGARGRRFSGCDQSTRDTTDYRPGGFHPFRLDSILKARGGTGTRRPRRHGQLRTKRSRSSHLIVWTGRVPRGPRVPGPTFSVSDITVYPAIGMAGRRLAGATALLLDIRDESRIRVASPPSRTRTSRCWGTRHVHNDGSPRILFTDEWGGGLQTRCRGPTAEWGADAILVNAVRQHHGLQELLQAPRRADCGWRTASAHMTDD